MKQFSYIPSVIQADHWTLGGISSLPKTIIRPDGQWIAPPFEAQSKKFETFDCSGFGTLNCVEILAKEIGFDVNYSDRFMGIVAGTTVRGNDPHTVAEALRHYGAIADYDLPFDDSLQNVDEFYSFKGNDEQTCRDAGNDWTKAFTFGHEWVFSGYIGNKIELLKEALQYSPLGVAGYAWKQDPTTGLYTSKGTTGYTHWFVIIGFVEGQYWVIDDSYLEDGTSIKHLEWDFDFGCAKRYYLKKNDVWVKQPWYSAMLLGVLKFFGL